MIAILTLEHEGVRKYQAVTVPDPARIQAAANIKRYVDLAAGREIVEITYPKQAVSIRQPWVWGIMHGGKDLENRSRKICRPGWYFVHSSKGLSISDYQGSAHTLEKMTGVVPPSMNEIDMYNPEGIIKTGGVVGLMKLGEWVTSSVSPWFIGPKAVKIEAVVPLPFQAGPGKQGVFSWDHDRAELE